MSKNPTLILMLVVLLTLAAGAFVYPKELPNLFFNQLMPWRLGLDLIGGSHLVYEVDMSNVAGADRGSVLSGLRNIMERRVNVFGVSEPQVYTSKAGESRRIVVELAGVRNAEEAIKHIGRTAQLDFRETIQVSDQELSFPQVAGQLTGRYLKNAQIILGQQLGEPQIAIEFNDEGAKLFEEITARNIGKPVGIFLDDQLVSAPRVQEAISGGRAVISGSFTQDDARALTGLLNAGALPAPIKLLNQQTIGASLGADSLKRTLAAGLIGTILVMLFMLIYYKKLGFFSVLALLIYVVLTLAVFKGFAITMTLAGIAGFILSIGMAVDANVLIFERTKEELKKGVSHLAAVEDGFKRAWPSIRDSNISTIITSVILYYFTTGFVKGFALALLIGVIVSMFSAISVTRTLLRVFTKKVQSLGT